MQVRSIIPTNTDPSDASPYMLDTQQDLTVLFSRPVIALGSDYDNTEYTTGSDRPFSLICSNQGGSTTEKECDISGTLRWVTTSIARFTPNDTWPTGT